VEAAQDFLNQKKNTFLKIRDNLTEDSFTRGTFSKIRTEKSSD
jgi:hypothetical protein